MRNEDIQTTSLFQSQMSSRNFDLPSLSFFALDWGRSLLRLHKAHAEGNQDEPGQDIETRFSLETCAAKP
jgi:hypothetical protein